MSEPSPALMALRDAVQEFSNAISADAEDTGIVTQAVVIWEEMSFHDDVPVRRVYYANPTDNFSISGALGLATIGLKRLEADLL